MRKSWLGVLLVLCAVLSAVPVYAEITLEINDDFVYYAPKEGRLSMELVINSEEYIDPESQLSVYIDDELMDTMLVSNFATGTQPYRDNPFSYELVSAGINTWEEYEEVGFGYKLSATGLCCTNQTEIDQGLCQCSVSGTCVPVNPPEEYPCEWSISQSVGDYSKVSGEDGLKFITESGIFGPGSADPATTQWNVEIFDNDSVAIGTMRAACGSPTNSISYYMGLPVDHRGWVYVTKYGGDFEYVPGTAMYRVSLGVPFDEASMEPGYTAYSGPSLFPSGGVYKDGDLITQPGKVLLNGTTGYVSIDEFNPSDSTYDFVFLPPNGNYLCAYTPVKTTEESEWEVTKPVNNVTARHDKPYVKLYSEGELESMLVIPNCPKGSFECERERYYYDTRETYDANDAVSMKNIYSGSGLTVYGNVSEQVYSSEYSESAPINYSLPDEEGTHTIKISLGVGGEDYEAERDFYICSDEDNDGYCEESGDCNDTDSSVYPGAEELCNGIDDNCNNETDELFWGEGQIGSACMNWPGSVCSGTLVCTPDGKNVTCKPDPKSYLPGSKKEICGDGKDNDCDGEIDEKYDTGGNAACVNEDDWCEDGDTRECNNEGICRDNPGKRLCIGGKWGECIGGKSPETEVCNNLDDDCDGIVDNVKGLTSIQETKCGCYGGAKPGPEKCDDIDNDCDGRVDEDVTDCCTAGQTRRCGTDVGVCEFGLQRCQGGLWGACEGSVEPNPAGDICCNNLDDDCNDMIDEYCSKDVCNQASQASFFYWLVMGLGMIMVIVAILVYQFRERIFETTGDEVAMGAMPEKGLDRIVFKLKKFIKELIEKIKKLLKRGKEESKQQQQPRQRQEYYRDYRGYSRRDNY